MRTTNLEELTAISERLEDFTRRLTRTREAYVGAPAEADATIQTLTTDPSPAGLAYKLLGDERHRADARQMADTLCKKIEPALQVHLFEAERLHMQATDYLQRFIREAQQAPDVETAFLKYTNDIGLSRDQQLLLRLLEQTTIANVRSELATASPSRRVAMYRAAIETPFEPVDATVIALIEQQPPYPADVSTSESERNAAAELGRLIKQAREARIPTETATVHEVLDTARRAIRVAKAIGAVPVNPQHRPDVASAAAAVTEELASRNEE